MSYVDVQILMSLMASLIPPVLDIDIVFNLLLVINGTNIQRNKKSYPRWIGRS